MTVHEIVIDPDNPTHGALVLATVGHYASGPIKVLDAQHARWERERVELGPRAAAARDRVDASGSVRLFDAWCDFRWAER